MEVLPHRQFKIMVDDSWRITCDRQFPSALSQPVDMVGGFKERALVQPPSSAGHPEQHVGYTHQLPSSCPSQGP